MSELSDDELLNIFRNGNKNYAFNLLVRKYQARLYWHIRRLVIIHADADDVMQNTFIKAWNGLENFRAEALLFTWLYRIATNESITFLRKKRLRFFIPMIHVEHELSETIASDKYFNGNEIELKLQKAILTLPERQRLVFNMKYYDDLKYEQISEILKVTVGSLKATYHHAVKKIEKYIETD